MEEDETDGGSWRGGGGAVVGDINCGRIVVIVARRSRDEAHRARWNRSNTSGMMSPTSRWGSRKEDVLRESPSAVLDVDSVTVMFDVVVVRFPSGLALGPPLPTLPRRALIWARRRWQSSRRSKRPSVSR